MEVDGSYMGHIPRHTKEYSWLNFPQGFDQAALTHDEDTQHYVR